MRGLGILSLDAITTGAMSWMEVTAQILVSLRIYLQQSTVEDTLDHPCAYFNSAGGCSLLTSCKYSRRLPTDITEAKHVKCMLESLQLITLRISQY
jgi:hypothetical protein